MSRITLNALRKITFSAIMLAGSMMLFARPVLPVLFSDNMILQQRTEAPVWGSAIPGKNVRIWTSWNGNEKIVRCGDDGKWKTTIETPAAGGPYRITVSDGKKLELKNVMVGEVWICSGQSNMEMPLAGWGKVQNFEKEIASAGYPAIRLLQIKKTTAPGPSSEVYATSGGWNECSPETVGNFSAVAYFYARELHRRLNVPVGVIDVTWGGTPAEAWISGDALEYLPEYKKSIERARQAAENPSEAERAYNREMSDWNDRIMSLDKGYAGTDPVWAASGNLSGQWKTMNIPAFMEKTLGDDFDGIVWFRKDVEIPREWLGKDMKLELGPIDDEDICFFNGVEIGRTSGYNVERHYTVPARLLRKGKNVLAVRVCDTGGEGGIYGRPEQLYISNGSKRLSLTGEWQYGIGLISREFPPRPVSVFSGAGYPSVLYNAMLHPLIPYAMQGVIWYQGEANENRAWQYRDLFPLLIRDWRNRWGRDFPFYFVQLAGFRAPIDEPGESDWAELREAQLKALSLEHTGMAVTIDIGDAKDIHPKNKQEVGRRLSLIAMANTYGKPETFSGPLYDKYTIRKDTIEISFIHTGEGLVAKDGVLKGFSVAGTDHHYYWAEAIIRGDKVLVYSDKVPYPVAVRYGWASNPECTLYNKAGLPASPFRTDDWPGVTYGNK